MKREPRIDHEVTISYPWLYLIVTDAMAGRRNRYTTYQIGIGRAVSVIGRELTKVESRKVVQRFIDNDHRTPEFESDPL